MRSLVAGAAVLALALAPAAARADPADTEHAAAQLTAAIKARDAKAIAQQLHARLEYAGVWFADPACARRFAKQAELGDAEREAFARCLAQLKLQPSTRRSAQPEGVVLTYAPGIELEVLFSGPRVVWIGFEAQGFKDANVPTLSAQAFEALRKTGSTNVDAKIGTRLERAAAAGPVTAWLKLCLDAAGGVVSTELRGSTTTYAGELLAETAKDWTFRPFVHAGKPLPVCSLSLLTYPAAKALPVETLPAASDVPSGADLAGSGPGVPGGIPPADLEQRRRRGVREIEPAAAVKQEMRKAGTQHAKVHSTWKVCVDERGEISTVALLQSSGYPAYDTQVEAAIRQWAFRPYEVDGTVVGVCSSTRLTYAMPP